MTKKHYEAIARILRELKVWYRINDNGGIGAVIDELADYFEQDNPRFDRVRFLKACGVEQEERCECGNLPYTDTENCKECCSGDKCTYGCGTCFCGCHNVEETGGKLQEEVCDECGEVHDHENEVMSRA